MIAKLLFFLFSFVLAGSSLSPKILANFNEKIVAGDINALQSFIETNSRFIKSSSTMSYRNEGFILAVQEGHSSIVELLLKKTKIDAAANNNKAIRLASANGYIDIVRMLLRRPEVNAGVMYNQSLIEATRMGHIEVVRLLLLHPTVDPSARNFRAVSLASKLNYPDIEKLFIIDERVNPSIFKIQTLERAAYFGKVDSVRYLLGYPYYRYLARLIFITGDLASIRSIVEAGFQIDKETLSRSLQYARSKGKDDVVQFLESL